MFFVMIEILILLAVKDVICPIANTLVTLPCGEVYDVFTVTYRVQNHRTPTGDRAVSLSRRDAVKHATRV